MYKYIHIISSVWLIKLSVWGQIYRKSWYRYMYLYISKSIISFRLWFLVSCIWYQNIIFWYHMHEISHNNIQMCGIFQKSSKQIYSKEIKAKKYLFNIWINSYAKQNIFLNIFESLVIFTKYVNIVVYINNIWE